MPRLVQRRSQNIDTALLQAMLNRTPAAPGLAVDGIFGPLTEAALRRYQTNHPTLRTDGKAGRLTWGTFATVSEIRHNVHLRAQSGGMGCWSAAAGMITNRPMSEGSGGAATGGGPNPGGLVPTVANITVFAQQFGWRTHATQASMNVNTLYNGLSVTPLWTIVQAPTTLHAIVISAMLSDATVSGTVFEIQDPWPVGSGTTYYTDINGLNQIRLRSVAKPHPLATLLFAIGP